MKTKTQPLTAEQHAALRDYATWAGEGWKRRLSIDWCRAGSRWDGPWGYLQQIRNTHGAAWLETFSFRDV